jgi:hypothetical protein
MKVTLMVNGKEIYLRWWSVQDETNRLTSSESTIMFCRYFWLLQLRLPENLSENTGQGIQTVDVDCIASYLL